MKNDEMTMKISALVDGELSPEEIGEVLDALVEDPKLQNLWERYYLMRAALQPADQEQKGSDSPIGSSFSSS